jgi:5-methylcytosine-specific restriction endonuclease McrA
MIITKFVYLTWWGNVIKFYSKLGYSGKTREKVKIKVTDLLPKSDTIVERKCEICGKVEKVRYSLAYKSPNYCNHCIKTKILVGENSSNYKDSSRSKCIVCGKEISKYKNYKYCKSCFGKIHSGSNHYRWKKDRSEIIRRNGSMSKWSNKVKERDKFTCQICGLIDENNKNKSLVSHHIMSFDENKELMYDLDNGICLCKNCHKEFHKLYGYGKNNKIQFNEFKEKKNV